jgi:hypothetical protein
MKKSITFAVAGILSLLCANGISLAKAPYEGGDGGGSDCSTTESCESPGTPGNSTFGHSHQENNVKHPNAGLGNGGEAGDPGQSGQHNAVCGLALGAAAGECDDPAEMP